MYIKIMYLHPLSNKALCDYYKRKSLHWKEKVEEQEQLLRSNSFSRHELETEF